MKKINFIVPKAEKIMGFLFLLAFVSYLKLFSIDMDFNQNSFYDGFYKFRFFIYAFCLFSGVFPLIRNKLFISIGVNNTEFLFNLILLNKKAKLPFNVITKAEISKKAIKIFYIKNNKEGTMTIPLRALGFIIAEDFAYIINMLDKFNINMDYIKGTPDLIKESINNQPNIIHLSAAVIVNVLLGAHILVNSFFIAMLTLAIKY